MPLEFLRVIKNNLRHGLRKLNGGTVRFYCGALPQLYQALNAASINYVVLRWSDEAPLTKAAEAENSDDVDHLIADNQISKVAKIAGRFTGPVKCDWYSASGQSGSSYSGLPYYMPILSQRILNSKWQDPRGFYRPAAQEELLAFAYHLCYHKGHQSGIEDGFDLNLPKVDKPKYKTELVRLAKAAGIELPKTISLRNLHEFLRSHGWNMPLDLMTRWQDRHPFIDSLSAYEHAQLLAEARRVAQVSIFVLRSDCETDELQTVARRMISGRFEILADFQLSPQQADQLMVQTRGGNWVEKYCNGIVPPTHVIVCKNSDTPAPLPQGMSQAKLKKRYPHLEHTDVLIKRDIRAAVNKALPPPRDRVVIHATDNPMEAAETLRAVYADELDAALLRIGL
jgi:hypothetical protein